LLLRPGWALALGIVASLTLVEAYRPYPMLVLIVFIPLTIKFMDVLRRSPMYTVYELLRIGVLFGLFFGCAFLMYSGWFQWSAPGFLVAAGVVFPWRQWRAGALLCGVTLVVFTLLSFQYIYDFIQAPPIRDEYFYFDAAVEPAYIGMWRGGLHGITGMYPPLGELGGVGLFTVVLAIGIGAAIVFGRSHTFVIALVPIMAGAWLLRYWHAHNMYAKKLVQLYPRTTVELFYCALILTIAAMYFIVERLQRGAAEDSPLRAPTAIIGVCSGFLFLAMSTSSSTIDKYMPEEAPHDPGHMAWVALKTPMLHESQVRGAVIDVSSSYNDKGYSVGSLIDGKPATAFSSELGVPHDHEEWIMLTLPSPREFSKVVLVPAADGFPVELTIELWDGHNWQPRIFTGDIPEPHAPQVFHFMRMEATGRIRVRATKLRRVGNDYVLRLADIDLRR
jgi:galactan 5-O-arabinofuranosyltransferase